MIPHWIGMITWYIYSITYSGRYIPEFSNNLDNCIIIPSQCHREHTIDRLFGIERVPTVFDKWPIWFNIYGSGFSVFDGFVRISLSGFLFDAVWNVCFLYDNNNITAWGPKHPRARIKVTHTGQGSFSKWHNPPTHLFRERIDCLVAQRKAVGIWCVFALGKTTVPALQATHLLM